MKNDANHRLATALGWTNIVEVAGALLGTPPPGELECRNQAAVPNWAGDWRECGPLIGAYHIDIDSGAVFCVEAHCVGGPWVGVSMEDLTRDAATRLAIVQAVCAKLEADQ